MPHAQGGDYDDSGWEALAPAETMLPPLRTGACASTGTASAVTIPERVGDLDPTGATVVFEVAIDDYAEVWVDGELPLALGDTGGQVVGGFNAPNRVVLTRDARPGERFQIAVFGINGPISASPRNYIWMRTATLDFYARERAAVARPAAFEFERLSERARRRRRSGRVLERVAGRLRVHRGPAVEPGRRAAVQLAEHERDLPLGPARRGHGVPLQERLHRAPTSGATTSRARTG